MKNRKQQILNEDMDVLDMKEYQQCGQIFNDYHLIEDDLSLTCDYDFLKHLNIGDEIFLINEETQNLSPFIYSEELREGVWQTKYVVIVTRKIYSATTLDVYVDVSHADDDYEFRE